MLFPVVLPFPFVGVDSDARGRVIGRDSPAIHAGGGHGESGASIEGHHNDTALAAEIARLAIGIRPTSIASKKAQRSVAGINFPST